MCGFALYFPTYSTWEGKALRLEDIYVSPSHRGRGLGRLLFNRVAKPQNSTGSWELKTSQHQKAGICGGLVEKRDGFLSENPCFQCLVVEDLSIPGMLNGYALYSSIYSARVGKVLWLEDIYLSPKCRGTCVGRALFTRVCKEAKEGNCVRMDFSVYTWNSAAGFYTKMGAENITNSEKWNLWHLERDGFDTHHPKYKCYVIDDKELPGVLCGYILFYPSYDAWKGPAIRIENIYVSPEYQRNNLGSLLYTQVAKEAYENGCCKVDVNVFAWNSATEFYSKLGAIDITEKEHYHLFRLDKKGIETLALKL
ncbi:hypothetical protein B566_EDAN004435 [Ephemera danica]|nr:hypothetical protein B566_EDAN004435 [Ephemera danica]